MTDSANASTGSVSTTPESGAPSARSRRMVLSLIGLVAGVVSLALATIPSVAYERPLPNPFAKPEAEQQREAPPAEREGGVTLKIKGLSINFGGKIPKPDPPVEVPAKITSDPVRWFTISAIACALIGLMIATVGQLREQHPVLTTCSMTCCTAAIAWQYIAVGITVGVAVVILLIFLSVIGPFLN
ncbi:MAG: hypothetical protein JSS49_02820 [Planctomycetes bacterium]|nr:hypothetical protein [Planctomycetota bacterium]